MTPAIDKSPKTVEFRYNRGNAYYGLKEYEKALVDFDESIRLDKDYALAWLVRGYTYYATGGGRNSSRVLRFALPLAPQPRPGFNSALPSRYI